MPEQEMSWQDAIVKVLEDADKPLHTDEITAAILSDGLKSTAGKTPSATVGAMISRMLKEGRQDIVWVQRGYYSMRAAADTNTLPEQEESDDKLAVTDEPNNLAVAAYGLHWERDKVNWSRSGRHLYGWDASNPNPAETNYVDFANQQGVYLLHSWDAVVYVGRTTAESVGLLERLRYHHSKQVWSSKWVRFSWFGMRQVNDETGALEDGPDMATKRVVSALMESVLIETLRPAFNSQKGAYMGTLYRQLVDPGIAEREARAMIQRIL